MNSFSQPDSARPGGRDTRPPLLYLPGLDGVGQLPRRQASLQESYQVAALSYPHDRVTSYEELAATAAELLEACGGGRPCVVLGESFGGAVALTLALSRPDLVGRLVLVNTFAHFPARLLIRAMAAFGRTFPDRPNHRATRGLRGWFFFAPDLPKEDRDLWWQRTAGVPMKGFGVRLRIIPALDLRPRLHRVTAPALVVAAPNDRVVPPRAGRELARLLPHARLIEPRVGHAALIHPRLDLRRLLDDPDGREGPPAA